MTEIRRPSRLPADRPWPPRPRSPAPSADGAFLVAGQLTRNAELRLQANGQRGVLRLEITTGRGFLIEADLPVSGEPSQLQAAFELERTLRRGSRAGIHAIGCVPRIDHGEAVLQLLDVKSVSPIEEEVVPCPPTPAS